MNKSELLTDLSTITGWVATISDLHKQDFYAEDNSIIKRKGVLTVEYIDAQGNQNFRDVTYIEDVLANTAKYVGGRPVFQPASNQAEINRLALEAYFTSRTGWKAYFIETIDELKKFAILTTVQKDTANKYYTQRVLVFDQNGLTDKNIEASTYIPV